MSRIGIIGGSGLYEIDGVEVIKEVSLKTPFGRPSGKFVIAKMADKEVVFLPRHGKGHMILPSEINYRANIFGMKKLGVEKIISISAVGSLKKEHKPLDIVIIDQFVDRTNQARKTTFFGSGIVAHIQFSHPICPDLAKAVYESAKNIHPNTHFGGTYLNMEGPAFSTKAESKLYQSWGMDVIGMTNLQEARLAREAEICYTTIALVTDYDCWYESEEEVSVEMIIANLLKNVDNAKKIIKDVIPKIGLQRNCGCKNVLANSIVSAKEFIPKKIKKDLGIIIGKYL